MATPRPIPRLAPVTTAVFALMKTMLGLVLQQRQPVCYTPVSMLTIDNIIVRIAGREIIDGATAALPAGRRIGLVGRNGAGKSTLLKLILGQLSADQGDVSWPRDWRVGAVAQEAPGGADSLLDTVLAADPERTQLMAQAEHETDPHKLGDIHHRLDGATLLPAA